MKAVIDQIKMWFDLIKDADMTRVSRAWWHAKARYYKSPNPWSTVKGPIAATLATLDCIGWQPISPYKWIDQHNSVWQYTPKGNTMEIVNALKLATERRIWIRATEHHAAKGLDCLLYTSPSPRDLSTSRMPSSA